MSVIEIGLLVAAGAFAGGLGGLFGIGGGVVIVPALYAVFGAMEVADQSRMKLAIGTSLATIVVTSARSLAAHARSGRVDWPVLRVWAPFIAAGSVAGAALAKTLPGDALSAIFAIGILLIGLQRLVVGTRTRREGAELPARWVQAPLAAATGLGSALMGIGGGVFGVLLLTLFGRGVHTAVATAAGFGLAIAVPGAIGFMVTGQGADVPSLSIGFVSLPAFAAVALASALTAPVGARLAHRLDAALLSRSFAIYLIVTGALLLREAFQLA